MSEYADWLEKWATTEGMGIEPELSCWDVDYQHGKNCDCVACVPADEQEWSPDQWQYWCRGKCTATELLRIWDVLP